MSFLNSDAGWKSRPLKFPRWWNYFSLLNPATILRLGKVWASLAGTRDLPASDNPAGSCQADSLGCLGTLCFWNSWTCEAQSTKHSAKLAMINGLGANPRLRSSLFKIFLCHRLSGSFQQNAETFQYTHKPGDREPEVLQVYRFTNKAFQKWFRWGCGLLFWVFFL